MNWKSVILKSTSFSNHKHGAVIITMMKKHISYDHPPDKPFFKQKVDQPSAGARSSGRRTHYQTELMHGSTGQVALTSAAWCDHMSSTLKCKRLFGLMQKN